jgi:enamine deaminase RidA (YjgF/YER057c/UK114 family)
MRIAIKMKKTLLCKKLQIPRSLGLLGFDPSTVRHMSIADQLPEATAALDTLLATVATNTWRAMQKIIDVETCEPKPEMKRVHRYIEAINDALRDFSVKTVDHTGQRYDTGCAVKVITSEKRVGLNREEIIETLKPTVRFNGRLLQLGEVVVGEPDSQSEVKN